MSAKVSSFENVEIGNYDYLFFVVAWNDYETSIKGEIDRHFDKFGEHIGLKNLVVKAYDQATYETADQILNKDWGDLDERIRNEQNPFLLVINTDFSSFEPKYNDWGIIWLDNYFEEESSVPMLFMEIQSKLKDGENLFDYFESMKQRPETKKLIKNGATYPLSKTFQIGDRALMDGSVEQYSTSIKKAVERGKTKKAIKLLTGTNSDYNDSVLLLRSRFERFEINKIEGVLSREEESLEEAKITKAVVDLVSKIEEES